MLKLDRPEESDSFIQDYSILDTKIHLETLFSEVTSDTPILDPVASFPKARDYWSKYKGEFSRVQHGRCGYCELPVIGAGFGDVEHFRPKGRIRSLDKSNQGREKEYLSNIEGRRYIDGCSTGYWWLAYDWNNYLFACSICNQSWKSDLFPVQDDLNTLTRPIPNVDRNEHALLINPFVDEPKEHLEFSLNGMVKGLTKEGLATIETVGLWRTSLVVKRAAKLKNLERNIKTLMSAMNEDNPNLLAIRNAVKNILNEGANDAALFPGVARIYYEQETGHSWSFLESLDNY